MNIGGAFGVRVPLGIRYRLHKLADTAMEAQELKWELGEWFEAQGVDVQRELETLMLGIDCTKNLVKRVEGK